MQMPDGRVIELKVRDLSEGGVGLMSDEPIPACAVVNFEMGVPPAALALALVLVPAFGLFVTAFHMPD